VKTPPAKIPERTLKAQNEYRDRIDLLRSRVNLLTGKDRLLMTMYLENSNSFRQMARLAGVNESRTKRYTVLNFVKEELWRHTAFQKVLTGRDGLPRRLRRYAGCSA